MIMDLGSQRQVVYTWLEELFGNEPVPEFELNTRTIQQLHQLAVITQQKDRNAQLVMEDLQQKTDGYIAADQHLSGILSRLNISPTTLSQSGVNSVKVLSKLGVLLDVKDCSDTSYFLSLQQLDDELQEVLESRQQEANQMKELTSKTRGALLKSQALEKALESVERSTAQNHPVNEKWKNHTSFLLSKEKSYAKDISKLQIQLSKAKFDKSFTHETLVKRSEFLKSLQDQLAPLRAELQSYSSLPPDLAETKIKVEQLKRELAALERKVSECIDTSLL